MELRALSRVRLPKINIRTRLLGLPKPIRLFLMVLFFVILAVGTPAAGLAGYNYYMARRELASCEKLFADNKFEEAALACETSVTYWFRQSVKDKARKAGELAISHAKYLEGLKVFGDRKWEEVVNLLSLVIEGDPGYPDAVEKLAQAKKEIDAQKVAGTQTEAAKPKVVYKTVIEKEAPPPPPPPPTDTATEKKVSDLEKKVTELENQPQAPPQVDEPFTLTLDQSEISAVVFLACFVDWDGETWQDIRFGSGTIVDPTGVVYTNKHVVVDSDGSVSYMSTCAVGITNVISQLPDYKYWAIPFTYSASTDIAALGIYWDMDFNELSGTSFPYLTFGSSDTLQTGDDIWVAGYPTTGDGTFTLTKGIVSGRSGDAIKTDAGISFGNSGGAAIDKNKKFVGIPTYGWNQGLGTLGYIIGVDQVLILADWVTLY